MIPGNTGEGPHPESFPDVAHAMESTISKAAKKAEEQAAKPRRRRRRKKGAVSAEVTIVRVDPAVWEAALARAAHVRNIQVVNEGEVIVWNHGPPWPGQTGV